MCIEIHSPTDASNHALVGNAKNYGHTKTKLNNKLNTIISMEEKKEIYSELDIEIRDKCFWHLICKVR